MKLDNKTSTTNPRTFGPLFGFILANILSRVVTAKYFPFQITYDPNPWLAYNKPLPILNEHDYPKWYPIKNYNYDEINYPNPILTPAPPHDDLTPPALSPLPILHDYQDNYADENKIVTTVDNIAAESNNRRRQTYRRTTFKPKRSRYPQKRRRTTTTPPPPKYYDSYEEYYDDNVYEDDDYDSVEHTTKYYRRKKPTRPTRRRAQTTETINYDDSVEGQQTEIVIVRQQQTTTTTTTEPQTIITNGTTTPIPTTPESSTTTANSTEGYGYGPFSGNDQISITYGPPFQYSAPYIDWYSDATSNSIIKKVRNIVGVDRKSSKFNKIN